MEVHKNQKVIARGAKFALTLSRQAELTAGTRGCHDEVASPPDGRHDGAGVVVLLLDTGIGTCRESAGRHELLGHFGKREDHNRQHPTWGPAVAGRTREACGPSAGFLAAGLTAAGTGGCRAGSVERRVRTSGCMGVGSDHRERPDLGRHARQRGTDEGGGQPGYRASRRADRVVSNRLASRAFQSCVEHTILRWFAGILRTAFLSRWALRRGALACPVRSLRYACPIHRGVDRPPMHRVCRVHRHTLSLMSSRRALPVFRARGLRHGPFSRACLAKFNAVRINPQFKRGISQDMPAAGMPFRSGAPL